MASRFIRIAVAYLVMGGTLGLYMGITRNFVLMPVHAHILLAGWLSLAMAGVIYKHYPTASSTRLASCHFWLHNLGLPTFMIGLAYMMTNGHELPGGVLPIGATAVLLGFYCFALNVWRTVRD